MKFVICAMYATTIAGPLLAQPVQPWLAKDINGQCVLGHDYRDSGMTSVAVFQSPEAPEKALVFAIKNSNWSVALGDRIESLVNIKSEAYAVEGRADTGEHMIFVNLDQDNLSQFARSDPKSVEIRMGNQLLTRLDFTGFQAGWNSFSTCLERGIARPSDQEDRNRQEGQVVPDPPSATKPSDSKN